MTLVAIVGITWPLVAAVVALLIGRTVRYRDRQVSVDNTERAEKRLVSDEYW